MAVLDDRRRVADGTVVRAMPWPDGTRLQVELIDGGIRVRASAAGAHRLAARHRVQLPANVCRARGLSPGDRVLLAGEPAEGVLVIVPPASLDALLASSLAGVA